MKKPLFSAFLAIALLSAPRLQAQTAKSVSTNTTAASTDWDWLASVAATTATTPPAAATAPPADDEAMMRSSGVMIAPGMSSSPYRGTSTDYNGRPVARRKSARPRSVRVVSDDPLMASSGVMLAPGMNTAPHRAASTDYRGRLSQRPQPAPATLATETLAADASVVATGW